MDTLKNTGRQLEFDFIKVFAIFFMILIHLFENISGTSYANNNGSLFTHIIEFVGGPLAAPVFMFAMGVGMVYSRHRSSKDFINRSWKLLLMGYFLNFLRAVLPIWLASLFLSGSDKLQVNVADYSLWNNFMSVDILIFAGMTFLLIGLLKKFRFTSIQMLGLALVMLCIGMLVGKVDLDNNKLEMITGIFFYSGPDTTFPLFLWFTYPVCGIVFGEILQTVSDKTKFYQNVLAISSLTFFTLSVGQLYKGHSLIENFSDQYYLQQNTWTVLWTLTVVLIAISLMYFLTLIATNSKIVSSAKFIGSNLNQIYIIHWLIIPYLVGFVTDLSNLQIIGLSALLMIICTLIRYSYLAIRHTHLNSQQQN